MEKKGTHFSFNTARAPYIKHDSAEVKEVVDFAERIRCMLELDKQAKNHYAKVG
jgi:hypothetical protein